MQRYLFKENERLRYRVAEFAAKITYRPDFSAHRFMQNTSQQYDEAISVCKDIFLKKMKDYGTAWRNLRPRSLTDQILVPIGLCKTHRNNTTKQFLYAKISF